MSRIHVTFVGSQPLPVYNGIRALSPDKVIFIYSEQTKNELDNLTSTISGIEYEKVRLSPTEPAEIETKAMELYARYKDNDITLNISGGTKAWAYIFGVIFGNKPDSRVIYIDQNNVLWDYKSMSGEKLDFEHDTKIIFKLYGNDISSHYTEFKSYTDSDRKAVRRIEHIRRFDINTFNKLTATLTPENNHKLQHGKFGTFNDKNSFVEWEKPSENKDGFVRIFIEKNGKREEMTFESPHAIELAFNSGWFEFKVADILSKWDKAKEIWLNCRFTTKNGADKNEIDILVNTGEKLLFVECKTQIKSSTDIDKFQSVVKNYGGIGNKALFVTEARMNDLCKEKCANNRIMTFSLTGNAENRLIEMLDSELYNINAK